MAWGELSYNDLVAQNERLTDELARYRELDRLQTGEPRILGESVDSFQSILDFIPDGVTITRSSDGLYVSVNDAFTALTGNPRSEAVGTTADALGLWLDSAAQRGFEREVRSNGCARDVEAKLRRKDGSLFDALLSSKIVRMGAEERILTVLRGVDERRTSGERLLRAGKIEAISELAGYVAHDVNNILMVVSGYADTLLAAFQTEDPLREVVRVIKRTALKTSSLTQQLLAFGRTRELTPVPIDINDVIGEMEVVVRRIIATDNITLRLALDADLGLASLDPDRLEQIIMSLTTNARDAMPDGGTLLFATERVTLTGAERNLLPSPRSGRFAMFLVSDTGTGMPPHALLHAFDPFFSTKARKRGLGLSSVYRIVLESGGLLSLQSEVGRGTTVRIYFPREEPAR